MSTMESGEERMAYLEFVAQARDEGLLSLDLQVVQTPQDSNGRIAIVMATARSATQSFSALGEASAATVPPEWATFLLTVAELRAKARALREFTGLDNEVAEEFTVPYTAGTGSFSSRTQPLAERSVADDDGPPPRIEDIPGLTTGRAFLAERGAAVSTTARLTVTAPPVEAPLPTPASPIKNQLADEDEATSYHYEAPTSSIDGIDREMESRLLQMATSIGDLDGETLSEFEARQKLDAFFLKAFRHPMSKASKIEGQRVITRLSGELSRRRPDADHE